MIDADFDGNGPDFYSMKERKARKPHRCGECCRVIAKGEVYEYFSGSWEGMISDHKTCSDCLKVRREKFDSFAFGEIWNDIHQDECVYSGKCICPETLRIKLAS